MRISGRRADGALHVSLGSGVAVVLKGSSVTRPLDEALIETLGPWDPALATDNEYDERQRVERVLNNASLAHMEYFLLGGAGSGNFGHSGRPGQEGGSGGGGGGVDEVGHLEKVDTRGMSGDELRRHKQSISDAKYRKAAGFAHAGRAAGPASATQEGRWAEPTDTGYSTKERAAYRATQEGRKGKGLDEDVISSLEQKVNPDFGEDKPDPGVWVKDIPKSKADKGRDTRRSWTPNERHNYERATGKRAKFSDAFGDEIVNVAKAAAQWNRSGTSTDMQANIRRNDAYRGVAQHLSARAAFGIHLSDTDLDLLTDTLTEDDVLILAAAFGKKKDDTLPPFGKGESKEEDESLFGEKKNEDDAVALDKFHSLDEEKKDEKKPVSEVAQATQSGEATAPPPAVEVLNLMPPVAANPVVDPNSPEERKKRRGALRDKIRAAAHSKGKTADMLDDEKIADEDLFAMAKELGVPIDETPDAIAMIDNADRFRHLLSTTSHAKHIHLAGGEHPFQYCIDNVVPSMAEEGKAPDDPEAFCAWWKAENS